MDSGDIAYAFCGIGDIPNRRARSFSLLRLDPASGATTPYHVVILRWDRKVHGYVNRCPHHGTQLDWERNQFFDPSGSHLMCGKHGALFAIETGACFDGPCHGHHLDRVGLAILDGEICLTGVTLAEASD